jgi:tetratricopeptide (TPR) repeat protein
MGNMGIIYSHLGKYIEALECFRKIDELCRTSGNSVDAAGAIGNSGNVYTSLRRYAEALECYRMAAEEHRALGIRPGVCEWLSGTAQVLTELVETVKEMPDYLPEYVPEANAGTWQALSLQTARAHAEECVTISEELSRPDTLFNGRVLLARIRAAEGEIAEGIATLDGMLAETMDDADRANVHYWLWKLNATEGDPRSEALRLYRVLIKKTSKHIYHRRIDELTAANEPTTSEIDNAADQ